MPIFKVPTGIKQIESEGNNRFLSFGIGRNQIINIKYCNQMIKFCYDNPARLYLLRYQGIVITFR